MSTLTEDGVAVAMMLGVADSMTEELASKIAQCVETARARLLVRIEADEVPEKLAYIVREVAVKRYNRIGSEGTSSHSVEGESMSWANDDFAEFAGEINAYLSTKGAARPRIRFI
jgi:hypothetical protein